MTEIDFIGGTRTREFFVVTFMCSLLMGMFVGALVFINWIVGLVMLTSI